MTEHALLLAGSGILMDPYPDCFSLYAMLADLFDTPISGQISALLTGMILPAVLIAACASLILSTANRLGRIFDRVGSLRADLEALLAGRITLQAERLTYLRRQLIIQRRRAALIQRAMAALYLATALFVAASLGLGLATALEWAGGLVPAGLAAVSGGICLFVAAVLLLYESRYNLAFIRGHIDFAELLERQARQAAPPVDNPPRGDNAS
jgi:hypothetical protein